MILSPVGNRLWIANHVRVENFGVKFENHITLWQFTCGCKERVRCHVCLELKKGLNVSHFPLQSRISSREVSPWVYDTLYFLLYLVENLNSAKKLLSSEIKSWESDNAFKDLHSNFLQQVVLRNNKKLGYKGGDTFWWVWEVWGNLQQQRGVELQERLLPKKRIWY